MDKVDITEGHFILMAALLYNERGTLTSEEELRADLLKAVETVRNTPVIPPEISGVQK